MARVSTTKNHDWLGVRVTFADGTKANVTWNRGGENVTVEPNNPEMAKVLSCIVRENLAKNGKPGYPFPNLGPVVDAMADVARASNTLPAYLEGLKTALQVTGEPPKPKRADNAPETTRATVTKKRGWVVDAVFPTGERMELTINARSVGLRLDPELPSVLNDVMKLCFGIKQTGTMTDEALAQLARETAEAAPDVDGWLTGMRAAIAPAAAPRR